MAVPLPVPLFTFFCHCAIEDNRDTDGDVFGLSLASFYFTYFGGDLFFDGDG